MHHFTRKLVVLDTSGLGRVEIPCDIHVALCCIGTIKLIHVKFSFMIAPYISGDFRARFARNSEVRLLEDVLADADMVRKP